MLVRGFDHPQVVIVTSRVLCNFFREDTMIKPKKFSIRNGIVVAFAVVCAHLLKEFFYLPNMNIAARVFLVALIAVFIGGISLLFINYASKLINKHRGNNT